MVVGKRKGEAHMIVSGVKGRRTSMICIANAAGDVFTLMVIHKGQRVMGNWFYNAADGAIIRCSLNGYINKTLFLDYLDPWLDWLTERGQLGNGQRYLVLIDGHSLHTNNYPVVHTMRQNQVAVLLLPSHASHVLQPLDKNPFSGFKDYWSLYLEKYNRKNCGKLISKEDFFLVFNLAWHYGMTPHNLRVGWKRCGLEPIDRELALKADIMEKNQVYSKQTEFSSVMYFLLF